MLGVIEFAMQQPAFKQDWLGDHWRALRRGFHFVAISAPGKTGAATLIQLADLADRPRVGVVEKNLPLQIFAGADLLADLQHLLFHEFLHVAFAGHSSSPRKVGVLNGQTAQEGAHEFRIPVRDQKLRIFQVKLQRVAGFAVRFKGELW